MSDSVYYPVGSKIYKSSNQIANNGYNNSSYSSLDNNDFYYSSTTTEITSRIVSYDSNGCDITVGFPSFSGVCPSGYTICDEPRSPNYNMCILDSSTENFCQPITTATPTVTPTATPIVTSTPQPTSTPTTSGGSTPTPSLEG